jgi:hypothetical protein
MQRISTILYSITKKTLFQYLLAFCYGIVRLFSRALPDKFPEKPLTFGNGEDKMKMVFYTLS